MKTKSGAKKRFRVTGKGKVKYCASGRRHILGKKSRKRKRRLRGVRHLSGADAANVRRLLQG